MDDWIKKQKRDIQAGEDVIMRYRQAVEELQDVYGLKASALRERVQTSNVGDITARKVTIADSLRKFVNIIDQAIKEMDEWELQIIKCKYLGSDVLSDTEVQNRLYVNGIQLTNRLYKIQKSQALIGIYDAWNKGGRNVGAPTKSSHGRVAVHT